MFSASCLTSERFLKCTESSGISAAHRNMPKSHILRQPDRHGFSFTIDLVFITVYPRLRLIYPPGFPAKNASAASRTCAFSSFNAFRNAAVTLGLPVFVARALTAINRSSQQSASSISIHSAIRFWSPVSATTLGLYGRSHHAVNPDRGNRTAAANAQMSPTVHGRMGILLSFGSRMHNRRSFSPDPSEIAAVCHRGLRNAPQISSHLHKLGRVVARLGSGV